MRLAAAVLAALVLAACPAPRPLLPPPRALPLPLEGAHRHDEPALAGVVHVVKTGETAWRIARAYGVDAADLLETNGLADARAIPAGARLFVPGATRVLDIPPPPADPATAAAASPAAASPAASPTSVSPAPPAPSPRPDAPAGAGASARAAPGLVWPVQGVLYGRYGVRGGKRHDGIDISAPEGTPVVAAAAGTVVYAGNQAGYGSIVILRHEGGLVTLYAHNARLLVAEGERVRQGQQIATVGQTGRTTGPHLHFEVREGTRPKNPLLFLP